MLQRHWDVLVVRGGSAGLVRELHCRERHFEDVELLGEWLDDGTETLEVVLEKAR